jgi:hypothetical protein
MSLNEVLERGQRVRLLSGEKGITIGENENFEFPLWEIKLNGIKLLFTCKWYLGLQYLSILYKIIDHSWRESSPDRIIIDQSGAENSCV